MKRTISALFVLVVAMVFLGCEKNQQRIITTVPTDGKAFVKINYAMPYMQTATVPAGIQIKINGDRVSNVITGTTYATPFPGGGLNTGGSSTPDYLAIAAGSTTIGISKPSVGSNNDSVVLFTGTVTLPVAKYTTLHLTDTGANAAMVAVENDVSQPDSGFSRYMFVHLMPNVPAVDLYHGTVKVASNIPYKGTSPTFTMVAGTAGSWAIRPAGAAPTSTALASYSNTIPNQRVLTVFSRGYTGVTGVRAPAVSLLYNR